MSPETGLIHPAPLRRAKVCRLLMNSPASRLHFLAPTESCHE